MGIDKKLEPFKKQSMWALIGLTIVTLTFYLPFWMSKQSQIINQQLGKTFIHGSWFWVSLLATTVSFGMIPVEIITNDAQWALGVSNVFEKFDVLLTLIWAFKIRSGMNELLESNSSDRNWYSGVWTFLFTVFYLQYKLNKIKG